MLKLQLRESSDYERIMSWRAHCEVAEELDNTPVLKFPWVDWANHAYKLRVCIINWPKDVLPPGPGFKIRKLNEKALRPVIRAYIRHCREGTEETFPRIVPWSDSKCQGFVVM